MLNFNLKASFGGFLQQGGRFTIRKRRLDHVKTSFQLDRYGISMTTKRRLHHSETPSLIVWKETGTQLHLQTPRAYTCTLPEPARADSRRGKWDSETESMAWKDKNNGVVFIDSGKKVYSQKYLLTSRNGAAGPMDKGIEDGRSCFQTSRRPPVNLPSDLPFYLTFFCELRPRIWMRMIRFEGKRKK